MGTNPTQSIPAPRSNSATVHHRSTQPQRTGGRRSWSWSRCRRGCGCSNCGCSGGSGQEHGAPPYRSLDDVHRRTHGPMSHHGRHGSLCDHHDCSKRRKLRLGVTQCPIHSSQLSDNGLVVGCEGASHVNLSQYQPATRHAMASDCRCRSCGMEHSRAHSNDGGCTDDTHKPRSQSMATTLTGVHGFNKATQCFVDCGSRNRRHVRAWTTVALLAHTAPTKRTICPALYKRSTTRHEAVEREHVPE